MVSGGLHDFSSISSVAPSGSCSACHIPHGANTLYGTLWARDLSGYATVLTMNGSTTGKPNYILAPTLSCYDCHDDHSSSTVDDIPAKSAFASGYQPQDIAFGGDGPGGAKAGYYEHNPPNPSGGSYGVYTYPGQFNPSNPDNLAKTGGHYFRQDPTGSTLIRPDIGDKLPCRDCHDPHSSLQAFLRTNLPDSGATPGLGSSYSSVTASTYMTNNSGRTRNDRESRKICAACHGYSDNGTPVKFNAIRPAYTNSSDNVPKPPATVSDHRSSENSACVSCHNHNSVSASCTQCHGYPPGSGSVPGYPAGYAPTAYLPPADSHARHVGQQDGAAPNSTSVYSFQCGVCHQNNPHMDNTVNVILNLPAPMPAPVQAAFAVAVPPGGSSSCSGANNLYCHSAGHDNTAAANYYKGIAWGTGTLKCSGCHGNVAYDNNVRQYGMPDTLDHANSHAVHVVSNGFECSVCHFNTVTGTYQAQSRAIKGPSNVYHVNGVRDVVFDNTTAKNGARSPAYDNGTKTCSVSCHGGDLPAWGATLSGGCFSCHSGTEQIHKPQDDYGTAGTPNPVDSAEYPWSGHGRSSAQGNYTGSNNLPAGFSNYTAAPVACYVCHSQAASHTTKSPNDPFRLGSTTDNTTGGMGTWTGAFADNTDLLCLGCHGTLAQRSGHDNAAKGTTTVDAQTHARGITGTRYNWPVTPWKCVDCHDPHGDGKSGAERHMMLRSGINAPIDNNDSNAGSDVKSRPKRIDANVRSVTFNSLSGYAAGSYAQPGNGTGGTWGPCEVCHTQTTAYSRTKDNLASHATRTNRCATCHPHKSGFAATACKGCHGPDSVATAAAAPEVGRFWTSSGHGKFTYQSRAIECEDCHDTSYLTASDHKTDGSAAGGGPPNNINTLNWPGKTGGSDSDPNANTAHLKAGYINPSPAARADVARTFDTYCATFCHLSDYHRHWKLNGPAPQDVMRFGDRGTKANPKLFDWYVWTTSDPSNYPTSFYKSRSSWVDNDIRSVAGVSDPSTSYGLCVSCHDPHGTGVTDTTTYPGVGTSNHMLRGNWLPPAGPATFCNNAGCHG